MEDGSIEGEWFSFRISTVEPANSDSQGKQTHFKGNGVESELPIVKIESTGNRILFERAEFYYNNNNWAQLFKAGLC